MRQATVYFKGEAAGLLTQHDDASYSFTYNEVWLIDNSKPAISLSLPKQQEPYRSKGFFPFFFSMLPEGDNKETICSYLKIDTDDYFGQLVNAAHFDAIGAVTVQKISLQ